MKKYLLLIILFSSDIYAQSILKPKISDQSIPKEFTIEPFCTSKSICLKKEIYSLKTTDYLEIKDLVSKSAVFEDGWLNSLEYIMYDVVLFKSYRRSYGSTAILLIKGKDKKWAVIKSITSAY